MNKISKKLDKDCGLKHYRLATFDFSSLQMRLCSIDSALNPSGQDLVLYNIYKDGSDTDDMHSMTGFKTFVEPLHKTVFDATDDNGKTWTFMGIQKMKIKKRDGSDGEEIVLGSEIKPTDTIIDYV